MSYKVGYFLVYDVYKLYFLLNRVNYYYEIFIQKRTGLHIQKSQRMCYGEISRYDILSTTISITVTSLFPLKILFNRNTFWLYKSMGFI